MPHVMSRQSHGISRQSHVTTHQSHGISRQSHVTSRQSHATLAEEAPSVMRCRQHRVSIEEDDRARSADQGSVRHRTNKNLYPRPPLFFLFVYLFDQSEISGAVLTTRDLFCVFCLVGGPRRERVFRARRTPSLQRSRRRVRRRR
jgi:hypothetical protein